MPPGRRRRQSTTPTFSNRCVSLEWAIPGTGSGSPTTEAGCFSWPETDRGATGTTFATSSTSQDTPEAHPGLLQIGERHRLVRLVGQGGLPRSVVDSGYTDFREAGDIGPALLGGRVSAADLYTALEAGRLRPPRFGSRGV